MAAPAAAPGGEIQFTGVTHQANLGDAPYTGNYVGSKSSSRALETFDVRFVHPIPGVSLQYMAHAAKEGDLA
jgi:hypothetical protein